MRLLSTRKQKTHRAAPPRTGSALHMRMYMYSVCVEDGPPHMEGRDCSLFPSATRSFERARGRGGAGASNRPQSIDIVRIFTGRQTEPWTRRWAAAKKKKKKNTQYGSARISPYIHQNTYILLASIIRPTYCSSHLCLGDQAGQAGQAILGSLCSRRRSLSNLKATYGVPRRLHCVTLLERAQYIHTQRENTGILQQQNTWTWKPPVVCSNQTLPLSAVPLPGLSTAVRLAWGHMRAGGENPIPSYYMYLVHVIPCMLSLTLVNFKPHPLPLTLM